MDQELAQTGSGGKVKFVPTYAAGARQRHGLRQSPAAFSFLTSEWGRSARFVVKLRAKVTLRYHGNTFCGPIHSEGKNTNHQRALGRSPGFSRSVFAAPPEGGTEKPFLSFLKEN
jgi:hypothetical protein